MTLNFMRAWHSGFQTFQAVKLNFLLLQRTQLKCVVKNQTRIQWKKGKEQLVKQNPTARAVKSGHLGIASRLAQASTSQASEARVLSPLY